MQKRVLTAGACIVVFLIGVPGRRTERAIAADLNWSAIESVVAKQPWPWTAGVPVAVRPAAPAQLAWEEPVSKPPVPPPEPSPVPSSLPAGPAIEVSATGPDANYLNRDGVYQIRVSNSGGSAAEGIQVVSRLSAGLWATVVNRPVQFVAAHNAIAWHVDYLPPGGTDVLLFKARTMTEGEQVQEVTASTAGGLQAATRHRTLVISRPLLQVAVVCEDGPLAVGSRARFTITLKNSGTKAAHGVRVKALLSEALSAVAADGEVLDDGQVTFPPLDLGVGESHGLTFQAAGQQAGDQIARVVVESNSLSRVLTMEGSAFFYIQGAPTQLTPAP